MSRLIENYLEDLFNDKNVSFVNRQRLWEYYNSKLSKAVDIGWNSGSYAVDDKELVQSLKNSIAEFSAFKETAFRKDVESLLTRDGKLMPKAEFKKEALKVSDDYNYRWLETERHQTIANANSAAQWKDFEKNVDLYPNLKLVSVHDARVRPEHKILDGVIRPFWDSFWDTHMTPLDWGCRCHLEQTDEEPTAIPGGLQMKIEFENNPGKTGKIFGGSAYEQKLDSKGKDDAGKLVDYNHLHQNHDFENNLQNLKPEWENAYSNLDKEQIAAVNIYSRQNYYEINQFNRGIDTYIDREVGVTKEYYQSITKTINKALDDIPDKYSGLVYRGADIDNMEVINEYRKAFETGKPHIEKAFLSSSRDKTEAFEGNVSYTVKSKTGAQIHKLSASPHEQEVLFKAGQKFKVTGFEDYNGVYHITMEEI